MHDCRDELWELVMPNSNVSINTLIVKMAVAKILDNLIFYDYVNANQNVPEIDYACVFHRWWPSLAILFLKRPLCNRIWFWLYLYKIFLTVH